MQVSLKIAMPCPPSRTWTRAQSTFVINSHSVTPGKPQPGRRARSWQRLPGRSGCRVLDRGAL